MHFQTKLQRNWPIKFFGTVNGEAVHRAAEGIDQHGNRRRIGSEMGMNMLDLCLDKPAQQHTRFGKINQMMSDTAISTAGAVDRQFECG